MRGPRWLRSLGNAPPLQLASIRVSTVDQRLVVYVFGLGIVLRAATMLVFWPAFLGDSDSAGYISSANGNLLGDPVHPAGYALFLRVLHGLDRNLALVPAVQHLLGVSSAVLLFDLGRKARSVRVGLVPAAVVLLGGLQLGLEHAVLSDSLFTFVVALILFLTVRTPGATGTAFLGVALAAAVLIRSVGITLIPAVAIWLMWTRSRCGAHRALRAAIATCVALGLLGAYVDVQQHDTGVVGLTASDGRVLYAIAAPFANCAAFVPPQGAERLCEHTPPNRRGSFNQYLWGFPDGGTGVPAGGRRELSPAWRLFGPMPNGNRVLAAFGRAAIVHQPVEFAKQTLTNLLELPPSGSAANLSGDIGGGGYAEAAAYYGTTARPDRSSSFGSVFNAVSGASALILLWVLQLSSLLVLRVPSGTGRSVGILAASAGWLLLIGSAVTASDVRYVAPALGPLSLAAAMGLASFRDRRRGHTASD